MPRFKTPARLLPPAAVASRLGAAALVDVYRTAGRDRLRQNVAAVFAEAMRHPDRDSAEKLALFINQRTARSPAISPTTVWRLTRRDSLSTPERLSEYLKVLGSSLGAVSDARTIVPASMAAALAMMAQARAASEGQAAPGASPKPTDAALALVALLGRDLEVRSGQLGAEDRWQDWLMTSREAAVAVLRPLYPEAFDARGAARAVATVHDLLVCVGDWKVVHEQLPQQDKVQVEAYLAHLDEWREDGALAGAECFGGTAGRVVRPPVPRSERPEPRHAFLAGLPYTGLAPGMFVGRAEGLAALEEAWAAPDGPNVVTIVAPGGAGKTELVKEWLRRFRRGYGGADRIYADSFHRPEAEGAIGSSGEVIARALEWFRDPAPAEGTPRGKAIRLAALVNRQRTLLVLDGVEPLQYPPGRRGGELRDEPLRVLLLDLVEANPGLCVLTSRYPIADLREYGGAAPRVELKPLLPKDGAELLRRYGVFGDEDDLRGAAQDLGGDCLALTLLGTYLRDRWRGDIARRDRFDFGAQDRRHRGHARGMIDAYERWFAETPALSAVMRLVGLFDRPASRRALSILRQPPAIPGLTDPLQGLDADDWYKVVADLRNTKLLHPEDPKRRGSLDCHPLVRQFYGDLVRDRFPPAWSSGHARLYDYYTKEAEEFPSSAEEMSLLYAAVYHGCAAGMHVAAWRDVYCRRIQRVVGAYNAKVLGAIGPELSLLQHFFARPWTEPVADLPEEDRGVLLHDAGYDLRALGRLGEAIPPLQASVKNALALAAASADPRKHFQSAAMRVGNLSGLYLSMGAFRRGLSCAKRGVRYADASGDRESGVTERCRVADALAQVGERGRAADHFAEAERLQQGDSRAPRTLHSFWGFWYCDFLLDEGRPDDVRDRARVALAAAEAENVQFNIGVSWLSLGRATLALAGQGGGTDYGAAREPLDNAVDYLGRSSVLDYLPRGLLARGELRRLGGAFDEALDDIRKALAVARRGRMRRHLTDCHTALALVHATRGDRRAARDCLNDAKRLADRIGYRRRLPLIKELSRRIRG